VASLLDRSLLQRGEVAGEPRFAMLETIREFALERLEEQPDEATAAGAAHADYFRAFAERAQAGWAGPHQPAWAVRLEVEHANLRAAVGWQACKGEAERDLRTFQTLGSFYGPPEGDEGGWVLRMQGLPPAARGDSGRSAEKARALALVAPPTVAADVADAAEALRALDEDVAAARAAGDRGALAANLRQLAYAHLALGEASAARPLCEEAVALGSDLDDPWAEAWDVHLLGAAAFGQGDHALARAAFEEELTLARASGSPFILARTLEWLGNLALEHGDAPEAAAQYEQALTAFRAAGTPAGASQVLVGLGIVALERGDADRARGLLGESLAIQRETGIRQGAILTLEGLAGAAAGVPGRAERALRLAAAASAARTRPGQWRVWPDSQAARDRLDRWLRPARDALDARIAEAAWTAGQATPLEEALAGALDD
jgi:tetratricopeptide (TPR) repeat protein